MSGIQNIIARETTTDRDRERGRLNQHSDVVNRECWLRPTGSSPGAQNSTPTSAIFSSPRRVRPWCRLRRLEELSTRVAEQLDASRARAKLARKSSARGRTVGRLARVGPVHICTPSRRAVAEASRALSLSTFWSGNPVNDPDRAACNGSILGCNALPLQPDPGHVCLFSDCGRAV